MDELQQQISEQRKKTVQERLQRIKSNQAKSQDVIAQQEGLMAKQVAESLDVVNAILKNRNRQSESQLIKSLRETVQAKLKL